MRMSEYPVERGLVVELLPKRRRRPEQEPVYRELQKVLHQVFFPDAQSGYEPETAFRPPTDLFETDEEYVVCMELAGVKREDFSLTFSENVLTVEGRRKECQRHRKIALHLMEVNFGPFKRSLYIPEAIEAGRIEATYDAGFLEIILPKTKEMRRVIKVEGE